MTATVPASALFALDLAEPPTAEQPLLDVLPPGPYRRLLQTGSRAWTPARLGHAATDIIRATLAPLWHPDTVLVTGDAEGADQLCIDCWTAWGGTIEHHPADWTAPCRTSCRPNHRKPRRDGTLYCPNAGLARNLHMVQLGADVCVEFNVGHSHGAAHCAAAARAAGIPVLRRTPPGKI